MSTRLVFIVGILMVISAMVALAYVRPQLMAYPILAGAGGVLMGKASGAGKHDRWGF